MTFHANSRFYPGWVTQGRITQSWSIQSQVTSQLPTSSWHGSSSQVSLQPSWSGTWVNTQAQLRRTLGITLKGKNTSPWLIEQYTRIKIRKINLSPACNDYKKASSSLSHTWILECLVLYKANSALITFIGNSVGLWKTTLDGCSKDHQVPDQDSQQWYQDITLTRLVWPNGCKERDGDVEWMCGIARRQNGRRKTATSTRVSHRPMGIMIKMHKGHSQIPPEGRLVLRGQLV